MIWLTRLLRRNRVEADLRRELQFHIAERVSALKRSGLSEEEARRKVRQEFGGIEQVKEECRDARSTLWIENLMKDVTYAIRSMRRTPGFTIVAVLILALGIGANTVIFRMVDAALLRPLPFPESDRLVRVWSTEKGTPVRAAGGPSALDMRDFAANAHSFEGLIVYDQWPKNVSGILGSNRAEEMIVGLVPRSYFELLRIRPILGRLFSEAENMYGRHYVAVISRQFWKTRFGGDPGVLGKTVRINGESYSIVGVVPDVVPGWMSQTTAPIHVWTPFTFEIVLSERWRGFRGYFSLVPIRVGPHVKPIVLTHLSHRQTGARTTAESSYIYAYLCCSERNMRQAAQWRNCLRSSCGSFELSKPGLKLTVIWSRELGRDR